MRELYQHDVREKGFDVVRKRDNFLMSRHQHFHDSLSHVAFDVFPHDFVQFVPHYVSLFACMENLKRQCAFSLRAFFFMSVYIMYLYARFYFDFLHVATIILFYFYILFLILHCYFFRFINNKKKLILTRMIRKEFIKSHSFDRWIVKIVMQKDVLFTFSKGNSIFWMSCRAFVWLSLLCFSKLPIA